MIRSFKHKGLEAFFTTGSTKGIQAKHAKKLKMRLVALETAYTLEDLNLPGFSLHPLKGERTNTYAIKVNGNWRLTFSLDLGDVYILDYEDYH